MTETRETKTRGRWIPVEERLPELGEWEYWDNAAEQDGYRYSEYMPVVVSGEPGWARLSQATNDRGKTAEPPEWLMEDNMHSDDDTVTHWLELPAVPRSLSSKKEGSNG